jgi:hypothetical protein
VPPDQGLRLLGRLRGERRRCDGVLQPLRSLCAWRPRPRGDPPQHRDGEAVGTALDVGEDRAASVLAFSGDDHLLAVVTLRLVDVTSYRFVFSLQLWDVDRRTLVGGRSLVDWEGEKGYGALAFSRDSDLLVAAGPGTGPFVWDLDPESWTRNACRLAGRELTPGEWRTYVGSGREGERTCRVAS